jgi:hypothetical protein
MRTSLCSAVLLALTNTAGAQPLPEPLPMGVPYVYQPGNNYWYAPALPAYGPYWTQPVVAVVPGGVPLRVVPGAAVVYPYPFASSGPVFGRYSWDYTGAYAGGFGAYSLAMPHYPYSYQYPTLTGRVWMGYGW